METTALRSGNVHRHNALPLSLKTGSLEKRIISYSRYFRELWFLTPATLSETGRTVSPRLKRRNQRDFSSFIDDIFLDSRTRGIGSASAEERTDTLMLECRKQLAKLLRVVGIECNETLVKGKIRSAHQFLKKVQDFDPQMSRENVYQALRNVWIANFLQVLAGMEVECTDPIFAYSMLYPYTDNVMDDHRLSKMKKLEFSRRLKRCIEGTLTVPRPGAERKIYDLMKRIEKWYPRSRFPGVYESILGIYNAQLKSLSQQEGNGDIPEKEVLRLSFEKGGTSVLADAYLVSGRLSESRERFAFGFGTFLQLADDIQDIEPDRRRRNATLFSRSAEKEPLGFQAGRLFHYADAVIGRGIVEPRFHSIRETLKRSFYLHISEAVGKNRRLYSRSFTRRLESRFPFRFRFLKKVRKKLARMEKRLGNGNEESRFLSTGFLALLSRFYE